ncbi:MAG: argininosuccinate lyase [Pyrinomonadaceae bacterium]
MSEKGNLWGGRFTGKTDETFAEFNRSFGVDQRLFAADVRASAAHANALAAAGILSSDETSAIARALDELNAEAAGDASFFSDSAAEDVHSFIESKLVERIGETGKKLHAGRSRNDQVATAFRLWLRDEADALDTDLVNLQRALVESGERYFEVIMPGYTHLQRAQPVLWAHWCLAYFEMLRRDRQRLAQLRTRVDVLPLGAGALAGTGFLLDREAVAAELGFSGIARNSLDAVSDRDFAIEFVGACSLAMVHLSRLAEDLIIYCSAEFGFVELSDAVSTGSSLMPQKKNPDSLELIRGKAGRVFGNNMALLATIKGLPLAYNKDMQEDKQAVFDSLDTLRSCLRVAAIVMSNTSVNSERTRAAAVKGFLNATELADYLVRKGVPFRMAHEAAGKTVVYAISKGKELNDLSVAEFRQFSAAAQEDLIEQLSLERTVGSKSAIGGTSPDRVRDELSRARTFLAEVRADG